MKPFKRSFGKKCTICGQALVVDPLKIKRVGNAARMDIDANAIKSAAYKCMNCGELICLTCTQSSKCKNCGRNTFVRVE